MINDISIVSFADEPEITDVYKKGKVTKSSNKKYTVDQSWYRGDCINFWPAKDDLGTIEAIEKFILPGWLPSEPFIEKSDPISAFGSCFAIYVSNFLLQRGNNILSTTYYKLTNNYESKYPKMLTHYGTGMVTTFSLRNQLEWAYELSDINENSLYTTPDASIEITEERRTQIKNLFDDTQIFIVTLGLSEIWEDIESGAIFWKAVPGKVFDKTKHRFRVSTISENINNIKAIIDIIRSTHQNARIVFTVSPIPLLATFRPVSCITANCVSKSILRAALDEVLRKEYENGYADVFYWPAYEIVKESRIDFYHPDNRNITQKSSGIVLKLFSKYFLVD